MFCLVTAAFLVQESLLSEIIPHDHVAYVCVAKGPEGKII